MEGARDAHAVLAEMGRVLGELEALVAGRAPPASPLPSPPSPAPPLQAPPLPTQPAPTTASLSAGPFAALDAIEAFGAALRGLEGVVDVVHRGFEGERALFDVRLGVPR